MSETNVKIKVLGKLEVTGVKPGEVETCIATLNECYKDSDPVVKVEKLSYVEKKKLLTCVLTTKVIDEDTLDSTEDSVNGDING